jgi:hypothetical protein
MYQSELISFTKHLFVDLQRHERSNRADAGVKVSGRGMGGIHDGPLQIYPMELKFRLELGKQVWPSPPLCTHCVHPHPSLKSSSLPPLSSDEPKP